MTARIFTLGNVIEIGVTNTDQDTGSVYDPAGITLLITAPDGTETTIEEGSLTRVSTGVYQYLYTPATSGHYSVRWEMTGPASALEQFFDIETIYGV